MLDFRIDLLFMSFGRDSEIRKLSYMVCWVHGVIDKAMKIECFGIFCRILKIGSRIDFEIPAS